MRRIADLIGHPVTVQIQCGCTRVIAAQPAFFIDKFGPEATIEIAEKRMRCSTCGKRPKLYAKKDWAVSGPRDRRQNPPPFPDWVSD